MALAEITSTITGHIDFDGMYNRLSEADGTSVSAGLFGGFSAQKAMWNEYGTSRGIPARPFLRNTMYERGPEWSAFIAPRILSLINGPADIAQPLGERMAADIRRTIDAGGFAPLAQSTIRRKGSSQALIDTGDMYSDITWQKGK